MISQKAKVAVSAGNVWFLAALGVSHSFLFVGFFSSGASKPYCCCPTFLPFNGRKKAANVLSAASCDCHGVVPAASGRDPTHNGHQNSRIFIIDMDFAYQILQ